MRDEVASSLSMCCDLSRTRLHGLLTSYGRGGEVNSVRARKVHPNYLSHGVTALLLHFNPHIFVYQVFYSYFCSTHLESQP